MYWDEQERTIPKDIGNCLDTDRLSEAIWAWGRKVEKKGRTIMWVIIIVGIIVSVVLGTILGNDGRERGWIVVIGIFIIVIIALITYSVYSTISMLICAIASINQNTRMSADLALYHCSKLYNFRQSVKKRKEEDKKEQHRRSKETKNEFQDIQNVTLTKKDISPFHIDGKCDVCGAESDILIFCTANIDGEDVECTLCNDCMMKYDATPIRYVEK